MKKTISAAERRHQDYLRLKGLKTAKVYEQRLLSLRRKEVRRVLDLCKDSSTGTWAGIVDSYLDESAYLPQWYEKIIVATGSPMAVSTLRDLNKAKAADSGVWLDALRRYAQNRAAEAVVSVTGTLKDTLRSVISAVLKEDLTIGVEKLTKKIFSQFDELEKWQVRRIAQTEGMIGMADAAAEAADTLDMHFMKQWAVSGLANSRESHLAMDGVIVAEDEPFQLEGGLLMYPHDTGMGAEAGEIINCACSCIRRPM